MVKTMTGTLPWAVVVVAIGGAIWWLLSRDMAAGRWLLAALLIGHGPPLVPTPKSGETYISSRVRSTQCGRTISRSVQMGT